SGDRSRVERYAESRRARHLDPSVGPDREAFARQLPAQGRLAGRVLAHFLGEVLRQEMQVRRDQQVGLVAMRDEALAALLGDLRDLQHLRVAADHRYVGLSDVDASAVEHFGELDMAGEAEIAA